MELIIRMKNLMKKCSGPKTNAGLLVLRIGVAAIFLFAGWMKVSDLHQTVGMFGSMGFCPFWAYVVSFVELLGGLAVLLGAFTRPAAFLLMITMIVAAYVVRSNPAMIMTPVSLLFSTFALTLTGGGKYSLPRAICKCGGECTMCKLVN